MINSLDTGLGDSVLLCSGFFQENFKGSIYQVSTEAKFDDILLKHKINITTVGVHNPNWLPAYRNFRNNLLSKGIKINAKYISNFHWHAKIYILKKQGRPIFGIVGSSNMTRNAFGLTTPFNYEADVILWLDEFTVLNSLISEILSEIQQASDEIIIADYDPEKNFGLSIEDRLVRLNSEIDNEELIELS
jgi:hypothetical protein